MRREIDEKLRRTDGTGSMQIEMRQQALDHIRIAPDRKEAFAEVIQGIDLALSRNRGIER